MLKKLFMKAAFKFAFPELPLWDIDPRETSKFNGQEGQDLWALQSAGQSNTGGFFVELGANDGILLSNTLILEQEHGWNGVLIEPSRAFDRLVNNRSAICIRACVGAVESTVFLVEIPGPAYKDQITENALRSEVIEVETEAEALAIAKKKYAGRGFDSEDFHAIRMPVRTLCTILDECDAPAEIDFLSLDVEGYEYEVLRNFDFKKYLFRSMCIERPNSDLRWLLRKYGYREVACTSIGDIFYRHRSTF